MERSRLSVFWLRTRRQRLFYQRSFAGMNPVCCQLGEFTSGVIKIVLGPRFAVFKIPELRWQRFATVTWVMHPRKTYSSCLAHYHQRRKYFTRLHSKSISPKLTAWSSLIFVRVLLVLIITNGLVS